MKPIDYLKQFAVQYGQDIHGRPYPQHNLEIELKAKDPTTALYASKWFDEVNRRKGR